MSSDVLNVIGWDIGGVNIKAGRLLWQNREIVDMRAVSHPFEIWRKRKELPEVLRAICREVPQEQFHEDVSSTRLRRADG